MGRDPHRQAPPLASAADRCWKSFSVFAGQSPTTLVAEDADQALMVLLGHVDGDHLGRGGRGWQSSDPLDARTGAVDIEADTSKRDAQKLPFFKKIDALLTMSLNVDNHFDVMNRRNNSRNRRGTCSDFQSN